VLQQTMSLFKITGTAIKRVARRPAMAKPPAVKNVATAEPDESQFVKFA
jgi:hypothetical protein